MSSGTETKLNSEKWSNINLHQKKFNMLTNEHKQPPLQKILSLLTNLEAFKANSLFFAAEWTNRRVANTWLRWVLGIIKHKYITGWGLCGNDAWILWHIAGSIYFSFMVDFYFNFNFPTNRAKASKF